MDTHVVDTGDSRPLRGRVVRDVVRVAWQNATARFSNFSGDAPQVDERVLRARYGSLDAWPVDAELGLRVLAWTLGSGFSLRGFRDALSPVLPDFEGAARAIPMGADPTQIVLNAIARRALENGSVVMHWNLNPEILYWPLHLSCCMGATFR